jgi:hypothetical protein
MTRAVHSHPFQPAWHSAEWRIVRYVLGLPAMFMASTHEPGFLECLAVIGLAWSLIIPAILMGGF